MSTTGPSGPVPQRSIEALRGPTNPDSPRGALAKAIPRRPSVSWWLGILFALAFAILATPTITADRWLAALGAGKVVAGSPATLTVRVPALAGVHTPAGRLGNGGIVVARGQIATPDDEHNAAAIAAATPRGTLPYVAFFVLTLVLGAIFTHHMRRSNRGRLVRVQIVSLVGIVVLAVLVKIMLLTTALSVLVVPVAVLAIVPTMALDRIVGLATGILGALVVALLGPFDVGVAILLLVQAAVAGLVVTEQPKDRWRAVIAAGSATTLITAATYLLLTYLTTGHLPALRDPLHSAWFAAAMGPAIATVLAVPLVPIYQLLVGEITRSKLIELEDLSHPLLRQIAEKSPGTWQHSLMMANMAEIAANAIGASGRLVRVGAYYHDLGKSLQPKYFIENLEPGETSPHDQLPPEVSCDAIFAHVTEGIVTARKAGLHERIVDFMHMHHGNGVLEYFWGKTKEQGNPQGLSIEQFRYPGHPPQSRETAILAICDAVEAASRTLKKPDASSIDSLVQRIVYGKLHLGQLDESGLSMSDLRRVSDSLRETIRHANHGRIEYPWQKAQQDASASKETVEPTSTSPRLDSLDRAPARRETTVKATPPAERDARNSGRSGKISGETPAEVGLAQTADIRSSKTESDVGIVETAPALVREVQPARQSGAHRIPTPATASIEDTGRRRRPSVPPIDPLRGGRPPTNPPPIPEVPATTLELRKRSPSQQALGIARTAAPDGASSSRRGPSGPPPDLITPATFGDAPPPREARKRAATLPPTPVHQRAPTVPPPNRRAPTIQPMSRMAGPPLPVDLENAVTNPPPLRAPMLMVIDDAADARITGERAAIQASEPAPVPESAPESADDSSTTSPAMPRFDLPLKAPPSTYPGVIVKAKLPARPSDSDLAARIDARLGGDEWGIETPVKAPTAAELRSLLGSPDPTKQQSFEEIERLHRASMDETPEPEILHRRFAPMPTAEVDPDDIESAIEVAPPARRPNTVGVAKSTKKSE